MEKVAEGLWLGNSHDAHHHQKELIKESGITAILNVAFDLAPRIHHPDLHHSHCGLVDGLGNSTEAYMAAILQLYALRKLGHTVLVHCHEGKSRSVSIVIGYLLLRGFENDWDSAVAKLKALRPIIDPATVHKTYVNDAVARIKGGLYIPHPITGR